MKKLVHAPKLAHKQAASHPNFDSAELLVKGHSNDYTPDLDCVLARREIPMICDEYFLVKLALSKEYDMYFQNVAAALYKLFLAFAYLRVLI